MKKLIVCLAVVAFTFSCSKDDDSSGGGKVTAKINGVSKTFNTVLVSEDEVTEGEDTYTELSVTAVSGSNATTAEVITFTLDKGDTGADVIYDLSYGTATGDFYFSDNGVVSSVDTNSDSKKLKGTFSGTLTTGADNSTPVAVTEGKFNFSY